MDTGTAGLQVDDEMTLDRFLPWRRKAKPAGTVLALQVVLETTLSCAVFYPRVVEILRSHPEGAAPAQVLLDWAPRIIAVSDKLASVISQLGGVPRWHLDCRPDEIEPPNYCLGQVTRLERAVEMLGTIIPTISDDPVRLVLETVVSDFNTQLQILREVHEHMKTNW